ncbi:hypothetical protein [Streptomyces sp. NBC_01789]|uniref:hypothetical protein n=1 Tax=Streptomyces sp. NBC_01789 TaxID=2975941 RepID=UPI0022551971|nr:hypothetical protein [Streptomyces sp. NBC_01789]MCX4451636.1 hypothetical protein [Streptomyces sp. NBC_01789]
MRFHITRTDADNNSNDSNDSNDNGAQRDQNGAIVGGVFGGVNHGIKGGVFYGNVTVSGSDDDEK